MLIGVLLAPRQPEGVRGRKRMHLPAWIDRELMSRCEKSFESGDFENAVFAALKVLEIRVAQLSGKQNDVVGVKLIDDLLAPGSGTLQLAQSTSEQQGIHQTYRGLFSWLRNASGHRFVDYGSEQAYEIICFVNFLLCSLRQTVRSLTPVLVVGAAMDRYILADLDADGAQEKLIVTLPDEKKNRRGQLLVLDPVGTEYRKIILLDDFPESSLYFLDVRDLNLDGTLEIIASAPAGAHGERMNIFRWDGQSYVSVGLFGSDAPSIEIQDIDKDGLDEVVVKQRDYASNPIANSIVQIFHWVEGKYQLMQESKRAG